MRSRNACLRILAGIAGLVVAGSIIAQAIRQGSWEPVVSMSWLPGLVAATWPWDGYGRCLGRGRGRQMSRPAG